MTIRILCDAIPFCFGPAAALETLLRQLCYSAEIPLEVDVLVSGSTREFLERSDLPVSLLPVDSEDAEALAKLDLQPYSAFLTICNPVSWRSVKGRGLPSSYVDFLLWMHCGPPGDHFAADLYLAENYPGTPEWVQRRGQEIPNLAVIPPLVQHVVRRPRPGLLLVGLGGLYSRLTVPGVNTNYISLVTRQLLAASARDRFERIMIAGPRGAQSLIEPHLAGFSGSSFHSFSHRDFLQALGECEAFLSHPGLYAPFEAMLAGVPTAFLPPSNYTQLLQLRHFRRHRMADFSFSWDDLGGDLIASDLSEPEGVAAVLAQIAAAECSPEVSVVLQSSLNSFLSLDTRSLAKLGAQQRVAAAKFSPDGPSVAVQKIHQWLQRLKSSG